MAQIQEPSSLRPMLSFLLTYMAFGMFLNFVFADLHHRHTGHPLPMAEFVRSSIVSLFLWPILLVLSFMPDDDNDPDFPQ